MAAPNNKSGARAEIRGVAMLGIGAATLRRVIASPLSRLRARDGRSASEAGAVARECDRAFAAGDPVNEVLEQEIIPQLLLAHRSPASPVGASLAADAPPRDSAAAARLQKETAITSAAARRFAELPLRLEAPSLSAEIDRHLAEGVSVEAVMLDLLAPAARRLGEMWERDECDFVDVTMGLWRLQEVMRDLSLRFPHMRAANNAPRRALFAPMPGDQHSFGAQMIEEVFARAGWQSDVLLQTERRELLDRIARERIDVLGLTVSRDCPSSGLSSLIKAIRSVAVNPQMSVIVGGAAILKKPAIVAEVGADGTGADAREALALAERLVAAARAPVRANSLI